MQLDTYETARALCERYGWQMANEYGEPGYSAAGPIIIGDFWCRCAFGPEDDRAKDHHLHGIDYHHPRLFAALEEDGMVLEWNDEWVIDDDGRAWRTQPDSYSWQSSILWTDGDFLTPDDGLEAWVEELQNDPHRALTSRHWGPEDLEELGWQEYRGGLESGWHPGQDDNPEEITREIRERFRGDVDVLFVVDGVGQFDVRFSVWIKPETISLSSGHFSTDQQLEDVVSFLEDHEPATFAAFLAAFPEWNSRTMGDGMSSWFDTDAMGVDAEWSSWAIDWIESNSSVYWEDGEPWYREAMMEDDNA